MDLLLARKKLKLLSCGKYRNLEYKVTEYEDGDIRVGCSVYVNGYKHHSGETWEEALLKMEYAIYPDRKPETVVENIETESTEE